jgi:predicted DNA-binding transcriptional regulator YafY
VVKFSKKLAPLIEEHRWRPDQEIKKHKDGSITFRTRVRGTLEVRRWIMSWGEGVRVLEPESLRKEIAAHSAALLKAHEKKPAE